MQFCFIPGCGTTNTIFILRQLQEKYDFLVQIRLRQESMVILLLFIIVLETLRSENLGQDVQENCFKLMT